MRWFHMKKSKFLLVVVMMGSLSIIFYGLVAALDSESRQPSATSTPCLDASGDIETVLTSEQTVEPITRIGEDQITAIPYDPEDLINRTEIEIPNPDAPQEGCEPIPETPIDETK